MVSFSGFLSKPETANKEVGDRGGGGTRGGNLIISLPYGR